LRDRLGSRYVYDEACHVSAPFEPPVECKR